MRIRSGVAGMLAAALVSLALSACSGDPRGGGAAVPAAQARTAADDCNIYQAHGRHTEYCQTTGGGGVPGDGGGASGGGSVSCIAAGTCSKTPCSDDPTQPQCQVALKQWQRGQTCYDAFAGIGDNIPMNTTDTGHEVANIDKIALVNGSSVGPYGYVYKDNNGQMYLQESPSYNGNFWVNLVGVVPVIGELVKMVNENGSKNTTEPITEDDLQKIKAAVSGQQPGMSASVTGCFKNAPTTVAIT
ncbi:MAG: hypothetical protein JOZ86_13550 [Candidatus Eremiobacteraeota bacterium]|nr:hypothetical protein [Candidatus Eremiobacteraeota bacterium]